jgi:N utilization substance protein B
MSKARPHPNALRLAARLAAVQALYQMDMGGAGVNATVQEYRDHRLGLDIDGVDVGDADVPLFVALVEGVVAEQGLIDKEIASRLAEGWRLERIDSIVRAVLRMGVYELLRRPETPVASVIDSAVTVTTAFFDGPEVAMVNAILDRVARETGAAAARA